MAFELLPATAFLWLSLKPMATNFDSSAIDDLRRESRTTVRISPNGKGNGHSHDNEFADLLTELGADPVVARKLGDIPEFRQPSIFMDSPRSTAEQIPAVTSRSNVPAVVYRDKDDVTTILNLTRICLIVCVIAIVSAAVNVFQFYRRPDRIIVDGPTGRVLSINDRNYGKEEKVELGPDHLTAEDKLYVTREFAHYLYQVDPATRPRDVEKALRLMVPDSAVKFSNWLKQNGILDLQKSESWQTIWTPMDVSVDANNAYVVNVIGKQEITKLVNGAVVKDAKQLRLTIKLVADPTGRADRNLRSGFLIAYIDSHELNDVPSTTTSTAPRETDTSAKPVTPVSALQDQP